MEQNNNGDNNNKDYEPENSSPVVAALLEMAPVELPKLKSPNIDEILEGFSAHDWLKKEAEELAEGGFIDKLAAVGLLGRIWVPTKKNEREALIEEYKKGKDGPVINNTKKYLETICEKDLFFLEKLAVEAADTLEDELEELKKLVINDDPASAKYGLNILLERDNLESVLFCFKIVGLGEKLIRALESLDYAAAIAAVTFREANIPENERLHEVASSDPSAWWSAYLLEPFSIELLNEYNEAQLQVESDWDNLSTELMSQIKEQWSNSIKEPMPLELLNNYSKKDMSPQYLKDMLTTQLEIAAAASTKNNVPPAQTWVSNDETWQALVSKAENEQILNVRLLKSPLTQVNDIKIWMSGQLRPLKDNKASFKQVKNLQPEQNTPELALVLPKNEIIVLFYKG